MQCMAPASSAPYPYKHSEVLESKASKLPSPQPTRAKSLTTLPQKTASVQFYSPIHFRPEPKSKNLILRSAEPVTIRPSSVT